ncbi:MAG: hypothetical protein OXU79_20625 [Gemmatimonadota bacterium]|nr:hypothetical protein [Gemmatimonadota bacterium]
MKTTQSVSPFENNWFLRHEDKLDLTAAERRFIAASMGPAPIRWFSTSAARTRLKLRGRKRRNSKNGREPDQ